MERKHYEGVDREEMLNKTIDYSPSPVSRGSRRFIQPLAVALAFLLFAFLFFGMAMIDLRRLEDVIMDALRQKALYVVDVTQNASRDKLMRLVRTNDEYRSLLTGKAIDDESLALQESLVKALIDMARQIDLQEPMRLEDSIRETASSRHLHSIALLDEKAEPVAQSSLLPTEIMESAKVFLGKGEDVAVHLFHGGGEQNGLGFLLARRHTGKGAVVLAFDQQDMEYWGWRIAIHAAIEELQWGTGVTYLSVEDSQGHVFAQSGSIPKGEIEECLLAAGAARDGELHPGQCVKVGDKKYLELSFPFRADGKTLGTARVGMESHGTDRLLMENRKHIFLWTGLVMIVGMLGMVLLYITQNRHISRMQAMRERLYQAERLSSLGKLGAGVAHEIRNPLNAISLAAQRLQREFAPEETERRESFERLSYIIRDEIRRLNGIVEDFLSLSRDSRMDFREQPAAELLDRVLFLVREEAEPRMVTLEKRYAEDAPEISMDARKMQQALLNIVRNAVESISGEGVVTLSCDSKGKDWACVRVRDTGSGIPSGEEKRIFDPFYTTKKNGVGLGLAIAHEIIAAHGGEIRVESEPGEGTSFDILLPRSRG